MLQRAEQSRAEREREFEVGEILAKSVGVLHAAPERINLDRVCSLFMRKHVLIDCQLDCVPSERETGEQEGRRMRAPFRMTFK